MMDKAGAPTVSRRAQRGVVLYVSLLLLLAFTLVGLAVTRNITFDQRMAATQRDNDLAFQAAEAALRDGESTLETSSATGVDDDSIYGSTDSITWETADWAGAEKDPALRTLPYKGVLDPAPARMPRFYLVRTAQTGVSLDQSMTADAPSSSVRVYRIIAKGWGLNANNAVVLESTYELNKSGSGRRLSWRQLF